MHPQDNPSQDHRANVILTPSQKGRKREELEHEAEVKKVREREEALEVHCDPNLSNGVSLIVRVLPLPNKSR